MKRWTFNILAGLSLVLCLLMAGLWAWRHGQRPRFVQISPGTRYYAIGLESESVGLWAIWPSSRPSIPVTAPSTMAAGRVPVRVASASPLFVVPYWTLIALLLIADVTWVRCYRRWRREEFRKARGLCIRCGYDLRASTDRCPECGNPIAAGSVEGVG